MSFDPRPDPDLFNKMSFEKPDYLPDPPPDYVYVGLCLLEVNAPELREEDAFSYFLHYGTKEEGAPSWQQNSTSWTVYHSTSGATRHDGDIHYALLRGSKMYNKALELYPGLETLPTITTYEF